MAYITVTDLLDYINTQTGGTPATVDGDGMALYQTLVDEAQAEIERVTGRTFEASASAARKFGPERVSGATLNLDDLLTITSVVDGDGTTVAALTGYNTRPRNAAPYYALVNISGSWAVAEDEPVTITGTWGFSTTAAADVKRLAKRLAYFFFQKRTQTGEKQRFGGDVVQDASEYPADIAERLKLYTRQDWGTV